jgi:hypothetical protein
MSRLARIRHRVRQFTAALCRHEPVPEAALREHLNPGEATLFRRMQPSDQAHAWQVCERLKAVGQSDPALLAAALLHDAGKCLRPLSLAERVVIVLGRRFVPRRAALWSRGELHGWRGAFVTAARHPEWGAELVQAAGASARTVDLVRRHQEHDPGDPLLAALQAADNEL